jgi:hypothetical protein
MVEDASAFNSPLAMPPGALHELYDVWDVFKVDVGIQSL